MQTAFYTSSGMGGVTCVIKLERIEKPKELTEERQKELTEEFKNNRERDVWNQPYIRRNLLIESNNKCAYCECFVGTGFKEMHVDHFHYKNKYVEEVVKWENLYPSCPHCNKNKSTHDTYESPIIDPFEQNPQDFFYIKNYRYYPKNDDVKLIVRNTIDVLGLNDTKEVVRSRYELGEAIINEIQNIYQLAIDNKDLLHKDIRKRNRVLCGCRNILGKVIKTAEYSAFMSTILQSEEYYQELRSLLNEIGLWDEELQMLDEETNRIRMSMLPEKEFNESNL